MSREYDAYLQEHKENVAKGFRWMKENIPEIIESAFISPDTDLEHQICFAHDASKSESGEYEAYDAYFYGGNRSFAVVENFNYAWLSHIHRNPHHWQHWVLIKDDPDEGTDGIVCMDMPYEYIIEMICDWWAFSWKSGNLYEIFDWYEKHRDTMKLASTTRITVELILSAIKIKLELDVLKGEQDNDGQMQEV